MDTTAKESADAYEAGRACALAGLLLTPDIHAPGRNAFIQGWHDALIGRKAAQEPEQDTPSTAPKSSPWPGRWPLATPQVTRRDMPVSECVLSLSSVALSALTLALDHADANPGAVPARALMRVSRAFRALSEDGEE